MVCIKRYKAQAGHGFYRELNVMLSVSSPHLVTLLDMLDGPGGRMLIMEYCSGGSLRGKLESTGPLSPREGVELGLHAVRGLRALHDRRLVHADLKPENVFIARRTGAPLYKLADFGIARPSNQLAHAPRLFSQAYAAPEQVAGFAIPASDIFSLGVMMGEVFGGDSRRGILPGGLHQQLVSAIVGATSADAGNRPDLDQLEAALETARVAMLTMDYMQPEESEQDQLEDFNTQDPN